MDQRREFKLNLPGLLQVLAEHLYSDRRVGIRELLQNAHDSCSRRMIEFETGEAFAPRIDIYATQKSVLEIEDNGSGLTEEEIVNYLATIGKGYTRQLREGFDFNQRGPLDDLIGQFGLGFLSAFLVAEHVELETLSCQPDASPILWQSTGDGSYEMKTGSRSEPGTRIRLRCKPGMRYLLEDRALVDVVARYCDLLPYPIYVGHRPVPSNRQHAPWDGEDFRQQMRDYFRSRSTPQPLWVARLQDWTLDLNMDSIRVPLDGVVFIPQRSIISLHEFGDTSVFIRNMFICDKNRSLLPEWAKFTRAIVSSPMLQPTASRESIHEDEGFELVTCALEQQLLSLLERLSKEDTDTWNQVVRSHTDLIVGWASSSEQFFDQLVDRIELDTSHGPRTIAQCLDGSNTLYCRTQQNLSPAESLLTASFSQPVIDANWFGVKPFLERYCTTNPGHEVVVCDGNLDTFLLKVPATHFAALMQRLNSMDIDERVVPAEFAPTSLAAVAYYPPEAELIEDAHRAVADEDLMPGVADLIPDWIEEQEQQLQDLKGILYVNTASPVIQTLSDLANNDQLPDAPLVLLVEMTRLLCQKKMSSGKAQMALAQFNRSLVELLSNLRSK